MIARINSQDSVLADQALNDLCDQYHYPLYCYIRRRGFDHHDAQDVLQDFFFKLLRLGALSEPSEEAGYLRGYLCASLQRFLINWHRDHRHEQSSMSVSTSERLARAEERYLSEKLTDLDTPERLFARKWAQELLSRVLGRLHDHYDAKNKRDLFAALKPVLINGGSLRDEGSAAVAAALGMTPNALSKALERMLNDYRDLLIEEVGQTVDDPSEIEAEITALYEVFQQAN